MYNKLFQIIGKTVRRIPCVSLLLTMAAAIIHLSYSLRIHLLYDRSASVQHELWRLITCHWVHLSTDHLFWSAATFLVIGSLCEIMDPKKSYAAVGIAAIPFPSSSTRACRSEDLPRAVQLDCALYALLMVLFMKREIPSQSRIWVTFFALLLHGLVTKII